MLIRQYGHQWPRWKVTATGPDRSNASRVIKWPESSGRKKGGIASPGRGAASPALLSWRLLDEPIDGRTERRRLGADRIGEHRQALGKRGIHVATPFENFVEWCRRARHILILAPL